MNIDDKLQNTLNELINKNDLSVKTTNLSNELLETLKILESCTSCKNKKIDDGNYLDKYLADLEEAQGWEKEDIIDYLDYELCRIDLGLNKKVLCEDCKGKKFEKLTDKCGNEEMARFLYYQCKLNAHDYVFNHIQWIPFNEFKNIEYLAKGGFREVHKATWIHGYYNNYDMKYREREAVLKRIYNNSSDDKIVDILNEVK